MAQCKSKQKVSLKRFSRKRSKSFIQRSKEVKGFKKVKIGWCEYTFPQQYFILKSAVDIHLKIIPFSSNPRISNSNFWPRMLRPDREFGGLLWTWSSDNHGWKLVFYKLYIIDRNQRLMWSSDKCQTFVTVRLCQSNAFVTRVIMQLKYWGLVQI